MNSSHPYICNYCKKPILRVDYDVYHEVGASNNPQYCKHEDGQTPQLHAPRTMRLFEAIKRGHGDTLIIRDNKIVGRAHWSGSVDGHTSFHVLGGEALQWTEALAMGGALEAKWYMPMYWDSDGEYMPRSQRQGDGWGSMDALFAGTRAVDEFELGWGMVPDSFCLTEGYRSAYDRADTQQES